MKIVGIIQARMGSTRLPGKMLLPLAGAPVIQRVLERVQRATMLDEIVLAAPAKDVDAFRASVSGRVWLYGYPGDEADLIDRYRCVAWSHRADVIVRIPGDNPCVDPDYIDDAVRRYLTTPSIFFSNTTDYVGPTAVDGIGAEVFSLSRLAWLDQRVGDRADWREHPHRYFEAYGLYTLPKADLRLDVNTQEDYEYIRDLYDQMGSADFSSQQAVDYLLTKEAQNGQGIQSSRESV
jgi:spore coat polysaccharide biosynthesis protein SpsF (cytidylyltransferase family)